MADAQTSPQAHPVVTPQAEHKAPPEMGLASLLEQIVDDHDKRALIGQEVERRQFSNNLNLATALANSGYFTDASDKWKALAKIEIGRSWGLSAADSMRHILMVNGKPSLENEVIAAKLRAKGWDWEPYFIGGTGANCKGVRLFIKRDGQPFLRVRRDDNGNPVLGEDKQPVMEQVVVEFLEADAKLIKVFENSKQVSILEKKGPWTDGWRGNMMYWRAIAQFRRFYANDVLNGMQSVDEVSDYQPQTVSSPALADLRSEIKTIDDAPERAKRTAKPTTITDIRKMKGFLGEEPWAATMKAGGFEDPLDIKTEEDAQAVLASMKALAVAAEQKESA